MKQWRVLSTLLVAYWIKLTGGNSCTLTVTASLDNDENDRLKFLLECGETTCSPPPAQCDNIHNGLAIECTRKNCGVMKTYTLCEAPNNICVPSEELQNRACPSATLSKKECMPKTSTITAYKTISQPLECTPVIEPTATILEPSSSVQLSLFSINEVATVTSTKVKTKVITSVHTASCSHIAPMDDMKQPNGSVTNQCQLTQALGALLGLVMILLAIVITGWVWTCWIMKKRGGIKITSDKQERYRSYQNPIYAESTERRQSSNGDKHHMTEVPTYATVSKPSKRKCGNKNNQANTTTTAGSNSQMHNYYQEPEDTENNYSLLGREESEEYNITERLAMTNDEYEDPDEEGEGWGQAEENVYHVLEGPAMAEGEGPIQYEATVYEVPVPSKPTK